MSLINTNELIESLKKDLHDIEIAIQDVFSNLRSDQLNWKPDPDSWSILECMEHITLTNKIYQERMKEGIQRGVAKKKIPKKTFRSGFLGNLGVKAMRPNSKNQIKNKMKTFKFLIPEFSSLDKSTTIESFLINLNGLKELLDKSAQVNLQRIKITSLAGNLVRFRLGDAFRFIIAHTQRHILQARKLQTRQSFPD